MVGAVKGGLRKAVHSLLSLKLPMEVEVWGNAPYVPAILLLARGAEYDHCFDFLVSMQGKTDYH